jgi:hypothetical protein
VLAVFYIFVSAIVIMFLADALGLKKIAFDGSLIQVPIFLAALYGFVQIVPFGSYLGTAGIDAIPRTISIDPFSSQVNAFHFLALALFFSVFLSSLNSTARIRTAAYVIVAFGFLARSMVSIRILPPLHLVRLSTATISLRSWR